MTLSYLPTLAVSTSGNAFSRVHSPPSTWFSRPYSSVDSPWKGQPPRLPTLLTQTSLSCKHCDGRFLYGSCILVSSAGGHSAQQGLPVQLVHPVLLLMLAGPWACVAGSDQVPSSIPLLGTGLFRESHSLWLDLINRGLAYSLISRKKSSRLLQEKRRYARMFFKCQV